MTRRWGTEPDALPGEARSIAAKRGSRKRCARLLCRQGEIYVAVRLSLLAVPHGQEPVAFQTLEERLEAMCAAERHLARKIGSGASESGIDKGPIAGMGLTR